MVHAGGDKRNWGGQNRRGTAKCIMADISPIYAVLFSTISPFLKLFKVYYAVPGAPFFMPGKILAARMAARQK